MSDFDVIECVRLEMARLEDDPAMIESLLEGILTLPATLMAPISYTIREYCRSTISGYESNSLGCLKLVKALYEHPQAAVGDVVQPKGASGATLLPQNKVPSLKECLIDILEDCIVGVYHNARTPDIAQNIYLLICWWRDSQAFGDETPLIEGAIRNLPTLYIPAHCSITDTMSALRRCAPSAALVSESCALESALGYVLSDEASAAVAPVAELRKADGDMDALMVALETFVRNGSTPDQIAEGITADQLEKLCRAHDSQTQTEIIRICLSVKIHAAFESVSRPVYKQIFGCNFGHGMSITELLAALDARHKALTEKCQALKLQVMTLPLALCLGGLSVFGWGTCSCGLLPPLGVPCDDDCTSTSQNAILVKEVSPASPACRWVTLKKIFTSSLSTGCKIIDNCRGPPGLETSSGHLGVVENEARDQRGASDQSIISTSSVCAIIGCVNPPPPHEFDMSLLVWQCQRVPIYPAQVSMDVSTAADTADLAFHAETALKGDTFDHFDEAEDEVEKKSRDA
ncbi:X-ray repair cross-complementing protein 6, partial [Perkinsus olseni]